MHNLQLEARITLLERLAPRFLEQASYYEKWSGVKYKDFWFTFADGRLQCYFTKHEGAVSGRLWVLDDKDRIPIELSDDGPWWSLFRSEIEQIRTNLPVWEAKDAEIRKQELARAAKVCEGV